MDTNDKASVKKKKAKKSKMAKVSSSDADAISSSPPTLGFSSESTNFIIASEMGFSNDEVEVGGKGKKQTKNKSQ
ncbi:hypothetical protein TL16_g02443 [Triparma laevis f. inornata]|uniref:Uncharacterized protein n=1 Tax=Triparma laevis f. inornata TaxID=1714386 RepID=A0A9W7E0M5_9STRA|nr:hypothetical protein TL16_g02443 [Triparma laevis f. inornata]